MEEQTEELARRNGAESILVGAALAVEQNLVQAEKACAQITETIAIGIHSCKVPASAGGRTRGPARSKAPGPAQCDANYGTRTVVLSPVAEIVKTPVAVSAV